MPSIRISINSKHHATVSLEEHPGVLSCILNYMSRKEGEFDFHTSFGGIDNTTEDYVDWPRVDLSVGDKVEFEILDSIIADPKPTRRPLERYTQQLEEENIKAQAAKLGWKIIENPSET